MNIRSIEMCRSALVLIIACVLPVSAHATFIHTYQGNHFDSFSSPSPFTNAMAVTGYFTTTDPLAANTTYDMSVDLLGSTFSFSNGLHDFTGDFNTVDVQSFFFSTDTSGAIENWAIIMWDDPNGYGVGTENNSVARGDIGRFYAVSPSQFGQNANNPGLWTVNHLVPETSTALLLLIGMLVFAALPRREKKRLRPKLSA